MSRLAVIFGLVVAVAHPAPRHAPVPNAKIWDRVAVCESGSNWHDTTGIYDGGLQFIASSWISMRGTQFAPSADRASRRQQMVVANRLLAAQGWNAWPVCSIKVGAR